MTDSLPIFRKNPHASRWTAEEDDILIASYVTTGGLGQAVHLLPHRTRGAIFTRMAAIRKAEAMRAKKGKSRNVPAVVQPSPKPRPVQRPSVRFPDAPTSTVSLDSETIVGEHVITVSESLLPALDLDRREHIRKRCIWTIQHLAQELSLMPVHVARVMQELARDDFRGARPFGLTHADDVPNVQDQSTIGRVFKLGKASFTVK